MGRAAAGAGPDRGGVPGRAVRRSRPRRAGRPRPAERHATRGGRRGPRRLLRRRRRHRHDEHVHRDLVRPARLRPRGRGPRHEPRGRPPREGGGRPRRSRTARRGVGRTPERDPLALAEGRRSRVPRGDVRRGRRGIRRTDAGPARRRRRHAVDRDDLRHAEREGGHRGGEGRRPRSSAVDQRHDRGSQRPHALRPDRRGVLELDRACRSRDRGHQLLARCRRDAPLRRGVLAHRGPPGRLLSERRAAQPVRWLRRDAGRHERTAARVRRRRPRQPRRRLLRHHPRSHRGDRGGRSWASSSRGPLLRRPRAHLQRARAVRDPQRHRVRDGRRAPERDRLGEVPSPDRVRRLRGRGRGGARPGAIGRQHARRQHGRRPARRRGRDDAVPEHDRGRARDRARAGDDRLEPLGDDPRRAEVRAGQRRRELDQPQGGRGRLPREGPNGQDVRRRRRRDVLRRAGPGRHGRAEGRDRRSLDPAARRRGRVRADRHHHRPEHPRGRDRPRGARGLREVVHRGDPRDQARTSGRACLRRRVEPELLVPRERTGAPRDPLRVPLPRDRGRARHGDRERGPARGVRGHPEGSARARRGHHLQPSRGRDRAHGDVRRLGEGGWPRARRRPHLARGLGRGPARPRPRARHRRLHRRRHRGGATGRTTARCR